MDEVELERSILLLESILASSRRPPNILDVRSLKSGNRPSNLLIECFRCPQVSFPKHWFPVDDHH